MNRQCTAHHDDSLQLDFSCFSLPDAVPAAAAWGCGSQCCRVILEWVNNTFYAVDFAAAITAAAAAAAAAAAES